MAFDGYEDPVGTKGAADAGVGYGEDIAKGAAGGLGRGVAGTVGIGGTVGNLVRAGLSKAGVPESYLDQGAQLVRGMGVVNPIAKLLTGPDASQVQKGIEDYTGPLYQPKTVPGQYASTIAEFAPGALVPGGGGLAARALNTVVPAIASETAGQLTKDTAAEPYARAITALTAAPVAAKAITPFGAASPARQAAVGVLEREGIPVTAGQRTGSSPLRYMESNAADMPFAAGTAQELAARQAGAYDRAITARMFDPAELRGRGVPEGVNLPDPRAVVAGKQSLSDEYTRLSRANQLRSDPQLQQDLLAAQTKYEDLALPSQKSKDVEAVRNSLVDTMVKGQGQMPGDIYQAKRSQLGTIAKGLQGDPYKSAAFREMKTALDAAMQRGLSPADAQAWVLNNQRYANMKQLEPAIAAAGENLSPMRVAQTARVGRPGQYAARAGGLDELANAASLVLKPLPQSGTAPRTLMQKLLNVPNAVSAGGGMLGTVLGGPLAGAALAAAPFAAARGVVSRPGQAYLGNQWLPQNPRDIITQTMMQQAVSQPGGIARNQAAQTAYEKKRQDDLRKIGLR
jgi:hypothetical protein